MKALRMPRLPALPTVRLPKQASLVKAFFLSRLFREKILLLGFILLVAATWLSNVVGRTGKFTRDFGMTSRELATQRAILAQQTSIEAAARAAVEHMDPSKTFDGVRLQAELAAMAQRAGVTNFGAENVTTERISQFTRNSVQVTLRNVDYPALVKFYLEVVKQTPYIGLEQVRVSVSNNKHSATMRVTSIELVK